MRGVCRGEEGGRDGDGRRKSQTDEEDDRRVEDYPSTSTSAYDPRKHSEPKTKDDGRHGEQSWVGATLTRSQFEGAEQGRLDSHRALHRWVECVCAEREARRVELGCHEAADREKGN